MNTYVVAWFSFHSNELNQRIIQAPSMSEAVLKYVQVELSSEEWASELASHKDRFTEDDYFDYIDEQVFNCDNVVNVVKL